MQAQFVHDPVGSVTRTDSLIQSVMAGRCYPVEEFEQRAADLSVDHSSVVENYRTGHRLFEQTAGGQGSNRRPATGEARLSRPVNEFVEDNHAAQPPPERNGETPVLSRTEVVRG